MTESDCLASLLGRPVPLVSDALEVAVFWNAKAGCTFAAKWLWYHEDRLAEVAAYHEWPHRYRQLVYCTRPGYEDLLRRIPSLGPRCVKFVRDPYRRAVSAYLHMCELAADDSPSVRPFMRGTWQGLRRVGGHPSSAGEAFSSWLVQARLLARRRRQPLLHALGVHLGRRVGPGERFSFREFVGFLGSIDLDTADTHLRRQTSLCERQGWLPDMTILRIEESRERLPVLEDSLGLRRSDHDLLLISPHHTQRQAGGRFVGDDAFGSVRGLPVPDAQAFYDTSIREAVARLYAEDLDRYGYAWHWI